MVGGEFNLDPRRSPHRHLESDTQACNRVWFMRSHVDLAGVIVAEIRMTTLGGLFTQPSQSMHVKALLTLGWVLFPWALGVKYMGAKDSTRDRRKTDPCYPGPLNKVPITVPRSPNSLPVKGLYQDIRIRNP